MIRRSCFVALRSLVVPATLAFVTLGCDGSVGNRVTGNVTFDGKPVPAGKVYFNPDASKGNTGVSGFAEIVNGKYDTSAAGGRGAPTGAVKISVEGNDPSGAGTGSPDVMTKFLFAGYETAGEVKDGETTIDIEVPIEAGKPPSTTERVMPVGP